MEACFVCGSAEARILPRTRERIYGLPGDWALSRCAGCGLVTLVDPPADVGAYYPKRASDEALAAAPPEPSSFDLAHYRAKFGPRWHPLRLLPLRGIRRGVVLRPGARHLDVGCHTGDFLLLTRRLGMEVAGVELDPHAAAVAKERGLEVHNGTLSSARFAAGSFDVVTLNHVFEHLPDPVETLREIRRILKPGGTLVLATPNPDSLVRSFFGEHWVHVDAPRHLHLWPPRALAKLAKKEGFRLARRRDFVSWHYVLQSMRNRRNARRATPKSYWGHFGAWESRWVERLVAPLLGALSLLRQGDEVELFLAKR